MRLRSREAVPDHWRRALRLSLAVGLLGAVGFNLVSRPSYERGPAVPVVKWALITLPVVTMPLLGKTSQVGAERILGTILGGALGFLASAVATNWWTLQANEADDMFLAAAAACAAFVSVLAGKRFGLDLSARLFVVAFLIVSLNAQQGKDPFLVALTRIGGIAGGVATMLLMSVLVLPKSASVESLRTLRKALAKLREINSVAWGTHLPGPAAAQQRAPPGRPPAAFKRGAAGDAALREPLLRVAEDDGDLEAGAAAAGASSEGAAVLTPAEHEAALLKSEKALTELYALLDDLEEQLGLAQKEAWVCSCGGRPFLLPGVPHFGVNSRHMPWAELRSMAVAIRRVARLLNTALFTLDGFQQQLREVLGPLYPTGLLPQLAASADAAIQELHDAFPRRQVVRALRRYRTHTAARSSWARLIDAALHPSATTQAAEQQGAMAGGAGNAPGADDAPNGAVALAEGAAAAAIPVGSPARSPVHAREPSLANWLRRVSSSALGGASEAAAATAAAPAALVASGAAEPSSSSGGGVGGWLRRLSSLRGGTDNGSAAAPAEAGAAGDGAPGGSEGDGSRPPSRPGSAASLHGSPFKAAAARERPGLPAVLDPSGEEAAAAAAAHAGAGAGDEPRGSDGGDAVLLSRASALALDGRGSAGVPLSLFPETPEGRLAQVSWYSFNFLCEELAEQLGDLHSAANAVLRKLPAMLLADSAAAAALLALVPAAVPQAADDAAGAAAGSTSPEHPLLTMLRRRFRLPGPRTETKPLLQPGAGRAGGRRLQQLTTSECGCTYFPDTTLRSRPPHIHSKSVSSSERNVSAFVPEDCCEECRQAPFECKFWQLDVTEGSKEARHKAVWVLQAPAPPLPPPPPPTTPAPPAPPPPPDGSMVDPTKQTGIGASPLSGPTIFAECAERGDLGCSGLLGVPRPQPLNDYRLLFMIKMGLDSYMKQNKVYDVCGSDYRLYASPLIKFTKACIQKVNGHNWFLSVRIGYPCFGDPRKVNGKIVGYPAFGRWRVHSLYV
ncbi:aluminum-activated malate transporter 10 [Micractinium conductrix]|uniref:Aluminum-activated malate transporter 10 n=1 Tax=Micractinium conductrix TaxID=554055 RepID=A0A2P6VJ00_9CHLO|nr:aluminum-activated malate transporter 10 [Micractinium conductrix]|eukprot:PSC74075.1 aluminum-activated malate transporter 10 [Micractinium conductrix]